MVPVPRCNVGRYSRVVRIALLLATLLSWAACSRTEKANSRAIVLNLPNLLDVGQQLQREAFSPLTSVRQLPEEIQAKIGKPMAESAGLFNSTDVRVPGLPDRRLVFAAISPSHVLVKYEVGGEGHHLVSVLFERRAQSFTPVWVGAVQSGNLEEFAKELETHPIENQLRDFVWQ